MSVWTLEEAEEFLTVWKECYRAIALNNQEYTIADRTYKRANLSEVERQVDKWANEVARIKGTRATGPVFRPTRIID